MRHHNTMLRRDDVSSCVRPPMPRVSNLTHARRQARACKNITKSTPYVTPSPTYLEAPLLPEPSTTLMFKQKVPIQIHITKQTMSKLHETISYAIFLRTDASKRIYVSLILTSL